jgi:hypothetical protein
MQYGQSKVGAWVICRARPFPHQREVGQANNGHVPLLSNSSDFDMEMLLPWPRDYIVCLRRRNKMLSPCGTVPMRLVSTGEFDRSATT